jgi:ATPase subunit of ABC transporter with duplicated ATPase domains
MLVKPAPLLCLDEPTNHLDIASSDVLEQALKRFQGTIALITHDRHLMERVTDDQFALVDGKIRHVPGGVEEYLRILDERSEARAEARLKTAQPEASAATRPADKPDDEPKPALSRAEEYSLKKELASTERKLDTLGRKAETARAELKEVDPSDYVALVDGQERLRSVEQQISDLEDEWMRLSEKLS